MSKSTEIEAASVRVVICARADCVISNCLSGLTPPTLILVENVPVVAETVPPARLTALVAFVADAANVAETAFPASVA